MEPERIARSLSELERKVIRYADARRSVSEIAKRADLSEVEAMRGLQYLSNKGVIHLVREEREALVHTERGRDYIHRPLPERRILDALKEGPKKIGELPVTKEEFSGVIGLLKKQGLVRFENGVLTLTEKGYSFVFPWENCYATLDCLDEESYKILNRRGLVTREKHVIWYAEPTPLLSQVLPHVRDDLIDSITPDILRSGEWKSREFRAYDVVSPIPKRFYGKRQPYYEFLRRVKDRLYALGFQEEEPGEIVLPMFWNSNALFMPQDHPASDIHDIYFVSSPKRYGALPEEFVERVKEVHERSWGYVWDDEKARRLVLRSHATALSGLLLAHKPKIPGKYFTISRVFRPDEFDYKHLLEFNQLDGVVLSEDITFRDLLGLLKDFAREFAGTDRVKFKAGYFPFTEPSVELFVKHPEKGWIEIGGAGMFREELLEPFEINVPVIAWGLGIGRFAMMELGITDIREFYSKRLGYLRSAKKIWRV
ncbi:MAG: phenylalanine--tRNA ligase subunit alpha [Candidatus Diapherotrites archaeon]|nr:phenylalanine--tRNA ligase subunit alpha [Candidatus Diapherotrites archaeon]